VNHVQVYDIPNFAKLQNEAMSYIPTTNRSVYGDYDIHATEDTWKATNKPYFDAVIHMIRDPLNRYSSSWGCTTWNVNTMWYHAYNEGGSYGHHTHILANMTGVIHLLLEDERDHTEVLGFDYPIQEGQVVLFPSMRPHRSPTVHGSKIIIGFNWDMHHDMKSYGEVQ